MTELPCDPRRQREDDEERFYGYKCVPDVPLSIRFRYSPEDNL
jgi:hypothetical protein